MYLARTQMNQTFQALLREAQFTKEMLATGATQIRNANYATKGVYFQAFTSLSTGLERIGKLCLMLDHYIDTGGAFPTLKDLKQQIGHKLLLLYEKSQGVVQKRSIKFQFANNLSNPIHQSMVLVLHDFAEGDRYSNIDVLVGETSTDPVARWFIEIDTPLYEQKVSSKRKRQIEENARLCGAMMNDWSQVRHTSETGDLITQFEDGSKRTGVWKAVVPHRQLYVLQMIRYWTELIWELEHIARKVPGENIPYFGEIFAPFYNDDSYLKSRKTWDKL